VKKVLEDLHEGLGALRATQGIQTVEVEFDLGTRSEGETIGVIGTENPPCGAKFKVKIQA
jgi:hypothetical protein